MVIFSETQEALALLVKTFLSFDLIKYVVDNKLSQA